jgi:CO/xanthine dehydrogenase Mo-binding subunit
MTSSLNENFSSAVSEKTFDRSAFLRGGGALIVAVGLPAAAWPSDAGAAGEAPQEWPLEVDPSKLDSWLAVHADGTVTVFTGKTENSQGNRTALPQIVAEELDVPVSSVHVLMGDTARTVDQGPTVGSLTIRLAGPQLRQAAANGRQALLALAATRLAVPVGNLRVKDGVVSPLGDASRHVSYGELVGGRLLGVAMPVRGAGRGFGLALAGAQPKAPSEYTIVGQSVPRVDIPGKVTGGYFYIQDVHVPGMLHGRVIRPPGLGSQLLGYGEPSHGAQVVHLKNFLGVVADSEWDAIQAARDLKVRWSQWAGLPTMDKLYSYVLDSPSLEDAVVSSTGDVDRALANAARPFGASYTTAIQTHGSIGPSCAVADVRSGSATVWSGTQGPNVVRSAVADALDLPLENVRIITFDASGNYGRNGADMATVDAALMSQLVGRPVRVQWSRQDEHVWDPKGPATVHQLRGGLDVQGNLVGWKHDAWIPAFFETTVIGSVLAGRTVRMPSIHLWEDPILYNIPASRQVAHYQGDIGSSQNDGVGLISAWVRSPVQLQLTFASESFFDELAAAAGADPVDLRLRGMKDPRMIAVLQAVAKAAKWQKRPSPGASPRAASGIARGRGVATSLRGGTYNAAVAEVEVDRKTGRIRVNHMIVAQDNGLTINPRAVKLGIEAGVVQSVGRTLYEQVTFDRSNVTSRDWHSYPIIRFKDAPTVDVILLDNPNLPATGSGEPSVNPIAPAIGNAVFDATGVRIRSLPMRPSWVKAAFAQQRA